MAAKHLIIFLVAIFSYANAFSQIKIHGKVIDEDNNPLEFATVRIADTALGTNTNLDGDYRITCPARDTITVVFTCIG